MYAQLLNSIKIGDISQIPSNSFLFELDGAEEDGLSLTLLLECYLLYISTQNKSKIYIYELSVFKNDGTNPR